MDIKKIDDEILKCGDNILRTEKVLKNYNTKINSLKTKREEICTLENMKNNVGKFFIYRNNDVTNYFKVIDADKTHYICTGIHKYYIDGNITYKITKCEKIFPSLLKEIQWSDFAVGVSGIFKEVEDEYKKLIKIGT